MEFSLLVVVKEYLIDHLNLRRNLPSDSAQADDRRAFDQNLPFRVFGPYLAGDVGFPSISSFLAAFSLEGEEVTGKNHGPVGIFQLP